MMTMVSFRPLHSSPVNKQSSEAIAVLKTLCIRRCVSMQSHVLPGLQVLEAAETALGDATGKNTHSIRTQLLNVVRDLLSLNDVPCATTLTSTPNLPTGMTTQPHHISNHLDGTAWNQSDMTSDISLSTVLQISPGKDSCDSEKLPCDCAGNKPKLRSISLLLCRHLAAA